MTSAASTTLLPPDLPSPSKVLEWLRDLAPAPYTPKPCRMADEPADGELMISTYSSGLALIFSGTLDFIRRWENLAVNCGIISPNQQLHWYRRGHQGDVAYICPRSHKDIKRGLARQFAMEMVREREVPVTEERDEDGILVNTHWNERHVQWVAARRAVQFYRQHITPSGIILAREEEPAEIYRLRMPGREGTAWGTGTEG